ncbi:helix-turn-helix transcriptional regulator [Longispora sp. K20-0274]|uniref:helix-turn-helix domain-containing protein n=1 Tax=Longispora sp. K20-0274 TaxID=3088255 RepID=UPI00399A9D08
MTRPPDDFGANPFAATLHRAIEVRGLSLERLQAKLAERDITVSLTTLSFWRRGRSRPERARSLKAVAVLEEVLGLPGGSLAALLGPPRPRGRVDQAPSLGFDQLYDEHVSLRNALDDLGVDAGMQVINPDLVWLSIHDRYELDRHGTEARLSVRHIGRAVGPVSVCRVLFQADDPIRPGGVVRAVRGCRRGRVRTDSETGLTVTELLFDRELAPGDVVVFDYAMSFEPGGVAEHRFGRIFSMPAGLYIAEVVFDEGAVPERCHEYTQASIDAEIQVLREVAIGAGLTATMAVQDVHQGLHALEWEWQGPATSR